MDQRGDAVVAQALVPGGAGAGGLADSFGGSDEGGPGGGDVLQVFEVVGGFVEESVDLSLLKIDWRMRRSHNLRQCHFSERSLCWRTHVEHRRAFPFRCALRSPGQGRSLLRYCGEPNAREQASRQRVGEAGVKSEGSNVKNVVKAIFQVSGGWRSSRRSAMIRTETTADA
jgi:hypothetical protein